MQVSFFLMQSYEPPVPACAVNEVLSQISEEGSSPLPIILAPFIVSSFLVLLCVLEILLQLSLV
uniref:DUF7894 domain-containing protein n=1 Tax=Cannabis sativa TaxID=3483 RepID=A0A803QVI0_CANSA